MRRVRAIRVIRMFAFLRIRVAHFLVGNQETGNQGPGNFNQEMGVQEKPGKPGKIAENIFGIF